MTVDERRAYRKRRNDMFRALMADRSVSADARIYGAHIYLLGDGQHELGHRDFAALSAGRPDDNTVRRRIGQLRALGYVAQFPNGRRNPLYEFAPSPEHVSTSVDPSPAQGENGARPITSAGVEFDPSPAQGSNALPSRALPPKGGEAPSGSEETTTKTKTTTGTREHLAGILGEHATAAMARIDAIPGTPADWTDDLWAFFRPPDPARPTDGGGTQWATLAKLTEARRAAVLADALTDFARNTQRFNGRGLRAFVEGAVREEEARTTPRPGRTTIGNGFGRPRPRPMDELPEGFTADKKFTGFKR